MPWFNLNFTDFIKKRVCKFLLNRYLGQFFAEKLSVDQICLDLYNGKGSVFNVELSCEVIISRLKWMKYAKMRSKCLVELLDAVKTKSDDERKKLKI